MTIRQLPWIAIVIVGCGDNLRNRPPADVDAAVVGDAADPDVGPPMLECKAPDTDAPIVWMMTPAHKEIGVSPDVRLVFEVLDGCGVTASSIALRIGGTKVTPIVTGDPKHLRIEYDPPVDFAEDAIVDAQLVAGDEAGNAIEVPLRFRIWDDYIVGLRAVAGIDSTKPTTASGWREYYRVEASSGGEQRMVGRIGFSIPNAATGARFVTARMRACIAAQSQPRTIAAYRLNAAFDASATWNQRSAEAAWAAAGANAVPADREAAAFATLTFAPATTFFSEAESSDITATVQGWYDAGPQNHGVVLVGAPGGVDVNNGNCPVLVRGFFGRALP